MVNDTKNFLWFVGVAIVVALFFVGITSPETLIPEPPIWVFYLLLASVLLSSELGYLFVWRIEDDSWDDNKLSLRVKRMCYAFMSKFVWFAAITVCILIIIVDVIGSIRTIKYLVSQGQTVMIIIGVIALFIIYIWANSLRYDYDEKKAKERLKKELEEEIRKTKAKKKRKKAKTKKKGHNTKR